MNPMYTQHVSEPWFTLIALGIKTVEGFLTVDRCFKNLKILINIIFFKNYNKI